MAKEKKKKKKGAHFIEEAELKHELKLFHESAEHDEMKVASERLGEIIMLLVDRYATMGCYAGYTFLNEMKSYARLRLLRCLKNIQPERNIHAYMTLCMKHSFCQVIKKEKKQSYIKDMLFVEYVDEVGMDDMSNSDIELDYDFD